MSSDQIDIRDARGATRGVVTHQVLSRNGTPVLDADDQPVTEDNAPRAEVVALGLAQGTEGNVNDLGVDNPLPSADYSPPLTSQASGEATGLAVGAHNLTIPTAGRVAVVLQFWAADPASGAFVRVGFGGKTPALRLYHGGTSDLVYNNEAVAVEVVGAAGSVAWQTWAAG